MKVLGIDLGTTNSAAAVWERGRGVMINNYASDGLRTLPSIVALRAGQKDAVVGTPAKPYGAANPQFTFTGLKRLLGRRFDDEAVQGLLDQVPFEIVEGADGEAAVQGPDAIHTPEELLALVLGQLKQFAKIQLQEDVRACVIAVPADFNEMQKAAVRRAAQLAGLEVIRTIAEPTAAALAYGLDRGAPDRRILVYDFGGGTFDVSILRIWRGRFKTLAQGGAPRLGGINFDQKVASVLADRFEAAYGVDPRGDIYALSRLIIAGEIIKKDLSTAPERPYIIEQVLRVALNGGYEYPNFTGTMTRAELEDAVGDLVEASLEPVRQALIDAKLTPAEIDDVVLVGGQTRMPLIQQRVEAAFGKPPLRSINPDEAVALGAAAYAAVLAGELKSDGLKLGEIAAHSIGVELADGSFAPILKRRDPLRRRVKSFALAAAGQTAAAIPVYQGDQPVASDNLPIATLVLEDIPPSALGLVDVIVDFDAYGVLHVSAQAGPNGPSDASGVHLATGLDEADAAALRDLEDETEPV